MMNEKKYPYELMEDPKELAKFQFCTEEIYKDLSKLQRGHLTEEEFKRKYEYRTAILCLDMTGYTKRSMEHGGLKGLLKIVDMHKVCGPVFRQFQARLIMAFADNFVVLFDDPKTALISAFEIHRRIALFNKSMNDGESISHCSIGIGYGIIYAIGINLAMGDEMNRASKLGEDIARGSETLLTESAHDALREVEQFRFRERIHEDVPFRFYEVIQGKRNGIPAEEDM